uniref:NADH-ubiquinone oxidoreductase chain 2 n=1 Tax=Tylosurus melanotus TaxID=3053213 RepID=A0A160EDA7_9TELE|nr:NADH dehydrogenase subunit 2 [Tylosurus acus melanotus]
MNPYMLSSILQGLGMGTTITLNSSHWLLAWMGLEMNTVAIMAFMALHLHRRALEAATNLLFTQAAAAALLLFATATNAWISGKWDLYLLSHPLRESLFTFALALKIGVPAQHAWIPAVLQGVVSTTGLIISTWQKFAPFSHLLLIQPTKTHSLIMVGIMCSHLGGCAGLNQTPLRKFLAYSSIAQLGCMMHTIQFCPALTFMSHIIDNTMTVWMFLFFKNTIPTIIKSLATFSVWSPTLTSVTPHVLLSMGGFARQTAYKAKWVILQDLSKQDIAPMVTLAAHPGSSSLYFYLRMSYPMTFTTSPKITPGNSPWRLQTIDSSQPLAISTSKTIWLLPLTPALVTHFSL